MSSLCNFVTVPLLELAEREFPRLWRHRTNREDALQTLFLVQFATEGVGAVDLARHALAWLEYELGVVLEPPLCPEPEYGPAAAQSGKQFAQLAVELEVSSEAA